jgi:YOP proteins translocation protein K (YscK)
VTGPAERASSAIDWATLMNQPVAYIDLTRLAACFGGGITVRLCERLRGASRLHNRLSAMVSDFYALAAPIGPGALDELDQNIALLPVARIGEVVRRAGVVYWANAIANVVRAEEVRRLRNLLGETLCAFALAHRNLSGPPRTLEPVDGADARITEDGMRCLGAWCQSQPEAVGGRVRLKSHAHPALDERAPRPFDEIGPAIIRCAAS